MLHVHTEFTFCLFFYSVNLLLYFSYVLYLYLVDEWYISMWTGILELYFVEKTAVKSNVFTGLHESKLYA